MDRQKGLVEYIYINLLILIFDIENIRYTIRLSSFILFIIYSMLYLKHLIQEIEYNRLRRNFILISL